MHPCNLKHLKAVVHLLLVHSARLVQTILGQSSGADVESALDDVLNALRERVPSTAKVAVENLNELGSRDVTYVLVCKVGDAHNLTLLDGPLAIIAFVSTQRTNLEVAGFIFLDYFRAVNLYLFYFESAFDNIEVVSLVVLEIRFLFGRFPHT